MPLPLLLVPLWEFVLWMVTWVATNKAKAVALVAVGGPIADAMTDGDIQEVWRRARNAVAALLNQITGWRFTGEDFASEQAVVIGLTREISGTIGIPLSNVLDRQALESDLEVYALAMIEQRTGVTLSSLRNVEALKADFARIAGGVITEKAGIPISNILDPEAIKADVFSWAKDRVMLEIGDDINQAVNAEWQAGVTMLQMVKNRTGKEVSPKALLRGVNDALVKRYMVKVQEVDKMSKPERRKLQNKMAQRRFRARANERSAEFDGRKGAEVVYVPKGWNASVTPPDAPATKLRRLAKRIGGGLSTGIQR